MRGPFCEWNSTLGPPLVSGNARYSAPCETDDRAGREAVALVPVRGQSSIRRPSSSQWAATFFEGCTRGGSPGILG